MATFVIPVRSDGYPAHDLDVELDGSFYNLSFQWNEREGRWYLSVADADGAAIISGVAVVADWDLMLRVTDERRPPGRLMAVDTSEEGNDPGIADLGMRVQITYTEDIDL